MNYMDHKNNGTVLTVKPATPYQHRGSTGLCPGKLYRLRHLPLLLGFQAAYSFHKFDEAIFFSILAVKNGCRGEACVWARAFARLRLPPQEPFGCWLQT
jgi:hypothetical protein